MDTEKNRVVSEFENNGKLIKGGPENNGKPKEEDKKPKNREGMSLITAAIRVLFEQNAPMKFKDIVAKVIEKGYWKKLKGKKPDATLAGAIYTESKKEGSRFTKPVKSLVFLTKIGIDVAENLKNLGYNMKI